MGQLYSQMLFLCEISTNNKNKNNDKKKKKKEPSRES